MFERLSAEPIYNTRAVVRRTGVPADTFRAWERRYGVPSPLRTEGNQRLYSERDIRMITWLREQTAVGLTISQAILLMRSTKQSSAPEPTVHPTPPNIAARVPDIILPANQVEAADPLASARRRLVDSFTRLDGQSAEHILQETYAWADLEVVLMELLHGAVVDVSDNPELRPPNSASLHFARAFVQRKFASLYNLSNPNDGRGPIVAASVEGEELDLTLLLAAVFLSRAGYKILFLGANLPLQALISAIHKMRPAVVCLAAASAGSAETLRAWIDHLRYMRDDSGFNFAQLPICYSGRVFLEKPELNEQFGSRFLGAAAQDAVAMVESVVGQNLD